MIPEDGRDVQCSNCGHTWFELPGPVAAVEEFEDTSHIETSVPDDDFEFDAPELEEEAAEDVPASRTETQMDDLGPDDFADGPSGFASVDENDSDDKEVEEEPVPDTEDIVSAVVGAGAASAEAAPKPTGRRPADAADLDILREEAKREMSQRRAPPSDSIETQADLGLDSIREKKPPSRALRARAAHLGEDLPDDFEFDTEPTEPDSRPVSEPSEEIIHREESRRDLLPDIEEINSTLKPAKGSPEALQQARQRSGFRFGFLLILFVVLGMIFTYAQAPAIARALPDTEPALIKYVDQANSLRDWISGLIGN